MPTLKFVLRSPYDTQYTVLTAKGTGARPMIIARKLAKHFHVPDVTVYHGGRYNVTHYLAKFYDAKREVWREYDIEILR